MKKKKADKLPQLVTVDVYGNDLTDIITARLDHHVKKHNKNLRRYIRRYSRIQKARKRK